jgi:hypothetical protein
VPGQLAVVAVWSPDGARLYFTGVGARREGDRFGYSDMDVYALDTYARERMSRRRTGAALGG